MIQRE